MKILVIGGGSIGHRYAAYIQDMTGDSALLDLDPAKVARFEKGHGGTGFTDFDAAMAWNPDGVVIATPHKTHVALATKIVKAGKPVLIEKPIGHDLKEVKNFLKTLKVAGGRAWTVSNMRFHPAVKTLRENIDKIGPVFFTRAHFGNWLANMRPDADYSKLYCAHKEQGGGVILDSIHEIDYLLWLFGACRSLTATSARRSDLNIDVEDYAAITMEHAQGVVSEIRMDYLQQYKRRGCEIAGRNGTLIWESEGKKPESCRVRLYTPEEGWRDVFTTNDLDNVLPYKEMLAAFIHAIKDPEAPGDLASAQEGAEALNVALSAYRAIEKRAHIDIKPLA